MANNDRTKITPQTFPAKPSPTRLNSGGRPLESGLYALMKLRKNGRPNGRTAFGKAFIKRQDDYVEQYGGNPSPAEMNLITDTTWTDFYVLAMDMELVNKKLTRRGKPHPLLDIRVKLAAHRRENLKLMGLKRTLPPAKSLADYMAEIQEEEANSDSQQDSLPRKTGNTGNDGNVSEDSPNELAQIEAVKESPDTGNEPVTGSDTGKDSQ